jgi:hypothetical protein
VLSAPGGQLAIHPDLAFEDTLNAAIEGPARGGHGGADWMDLYRLIKAVRTGTPPDIDVSDAGTWSCITELSEKSVARRSRPMDFPDFTRGRRKTTPPIGIIGL